MIAEALRRSGQDLTVDDVLARIRTGDAQYWAAPGAEFVTERTGNTLNIWLGAGRRQALFDLYLTRIEPWAISIGIRLVTVDGRKGWRRFAARYGFTNTGGNLLQKVLHG